MLHVGIIVRLVIYLYFASVRQGYLFQTPSADFSVKGCLVLRSLIHIRKIYIAHGIACGTWFIISPPVEGLPAVARIIISIIKFIRIHLSFGRNAVFERQLVQRKLSAASVFDAVAQGVIVIEFHRLNGISRVSYPAVQFYLIQFIKAFSFRVSILKFPGCSFSVFSLR